MLYAQIYLFIKKSIIYCNYCNEMRLSFLLKYTVLNCAAILFYEQIVNLNFGSFMYQYKDGKRATLGL